MAGAAPAQEKEQDASTAAPCADEKAPPKKPNASRNQRRQKKAVAVAEPPKEEAEGIPVSSAKVAPSGENPGPKEASNTQIETKHADGAAKEHPPKEAAKDGSALLSPSDPDDKNKKSQKAAKGKTAVKPEQDHGAISPMVFDWMDDDEMIPKRGWHKCNVLTVVYSWSEETGKTTVRSQEFFNVNRVREWLEENPDTASKETTLTLLHIRKSASSNDWWRPMGLCPKQVSLNFVSDDYSNVTNVYQPCNPEFPKTKSVGHYFRYASRRHRIEDEGSPLFNARIAFLEEDLKVNRLEGFPDVYGAAQVEDAPLCRKCTWVYGQKYHPVPRGKNIIVLSSQTTDLTNSLIQPKKAVESAWMDQQGLLGHYKFESKQDFLFQTTDLILKGPLLALEEQWKRTLTHRVNKMDRMLTMLYRGSEIPSADQVWNSPEYWETVDDLARQSRQLDLYIDMIENVRISLSNLTGVAKEKWLCYSHNSTGSDVSGFLQNEKERMRVLLKEPMSEVGDLMHKLVQNRDSTVSVQLAESMWWLSWITFFFLPISTVATVFGMNINWLSDNPSGGYFFASVVPTMLIVTVVHYICTRLIYPSDRLRAVQREGFSNADLSYSEKGWLGWYRKGDYRTEEQSEGFKLHIIIGWVLRKLYRPEWTVDRALTGKAAEMDLITKLRINAVELFTSWTRSNKSVLARDIEKYGLSAALERNGTTVDRINIPRSSSEGEKAAMAAAGSGAARWRRPLAALLSLFAAEEPPPTREGALDGHSSRLSFDSNPYHGRAGLEGTKEVSSVSALT